MFRPIKKPDGVYVFCDLGRQKDEEISLHIKHDNYHEHHEIFTINSMDNESSRHKQIRLLRKCLSKYTDCEWFKPNKYDIPANSEVIAFAKIKDINGNYVSAKIDDDGLKITSNTGYIPSMAGRRFTLNPEGEVTFIVTKQALSMQRCLIMGDVPHTESLPLYATYYSKAGLDGALRIPYTYNESIYKYSYRNKNENKWVSVYMEEN